MLTKVGTFTLSTSLVGGSTVNVSDVGFEPDLVLFWWSGATSTSNAMSTTLNLQKGFGIAMFDGFQFCWGGAEADNVAISQARRVNLNDYCFQFLTLPTGYDVAGWLDTTHSTGFRIKVDAKPSIAFRVHYLAIRSDYIDWYMGNRVGRGSNGTQVFNFREGFDPALVLMGGISHTSIGTAINNSHTTFSALTADTQGVMFGGAFGGENPSFSECYNRLGECSPALRVDDSTGTTADRAVGALTSSGFNLTWSASSGTTPFVNYLVLAGVQAKMAKLPPLTGSGSVNVGFKPEAVLVFTHDTVNNLNQKNLDDFFFFGAVDQNLNQVAISAWDYEGVSPSRVELAVVYNGVSVKPTAGLNNRASITALTPTGFNYSVAATTGTPFEPLYIAIAPLNHYEVGAERGEITLQGQGSERGIRRAIEAERAEFKLSGVTTSRRLARVLQAGTGSFSLQGQDVSFIWEGVKTGLRAEPGIFTLKGEEVTLSPVRALTVDAGSFDLTGQETSYQLKLGVEAEAANFTFIGLDSELIFRHYEGWREGDKLTGPWTLSEVSGVEWELKARAEAGWVKHET